MTDNERYAEVAPYFRHPPLLILDPPPPPTDLAPLTRIRINLGKRVPKESGLMFKERPFDRFWLLWSPEGDTPPSYRHPTEEAARTEAIRLANLFPSQQFFVCEAKTRSQSEKIVRTDAPW